MPDIAGFDGIAQFMQWKKRKYRSQDKVSSSAS